MVKVILTHCCHNPLVIIFLGILANLFFIIGGLFREPKHSMAFVILGNLTFIFYYLTMELYSPIISVGVGALACLVIINNVCPLRVRLTAIICSVVTCFLLVWNFSSYYDLLLIMASLAIACAQISKDNYVRYKIFVMMSQALWITYCLHFSDYAMLCTCALICISNTYALATNLYKDGTLQRLVPISRKLSLAKLSL